MYWTIHFEERIVTEKPFTQESSSKNNLRVERKTPSLTLGKVTIAVFVQSEQDSCWQLKSKEIQIQRFID